MTLKEDNNTDNAYPNKYCNKKYDPNIGYSLDCKHRNEFPYHNNHNNSTSYKNFSDLNNSNTHKRYYY